MRGTRKSSLVALLVAAVVLLSAGAAAAVSGGGYEPDQMNCSVDESAWSTPPNFVPTGCHDFAATLESGGMHNGDPNSNNTRFAEFGIDQSPNNSPNPSFGAVFNIGDPGTPDSPHAGCLAANTDGTGGGTGVGCGNNPNGAGFSATYDYYAVYCPATAPLPLNSIPIPDGVPALKNCAPGQTIGPNKLTPDTGSQSKLDQIATQGLLFYMGANDGLDNGEHDGFRPTFAPGAQNGPSDGGAVLLDLTPQNAHNTPTPTNPEGLANGSFGACADGICFGAATQQTTVYQGCGADNNPADGACSASTPQNDNVYQNNAPASTQESPNCSGGGPDGETPCLTNDKSPTTTKPGSSNPGGPDAYRQQTPHNMNMEPGVQTFQDPDPNRSPVAPFGTPGIYVGTCGVFVNDSGGAGSPGITGQNPGYLGGVSNC